MKDLQNTYMATLLAPRVRSLDKSLDPPRTDTQTLVERPNSWCQKCCHVGTLEAFHLWSLATSVKAQRSTSRLSTNHIAGFLHLSNRLAKCEDPLRAPWAQSKATNIDQWEYPVGQIGLSLGPKGFILRPVPIFPYPTWHPTWRGFGGKELGR